MRFIVEAQLPPQLADWLRDRGHDASALREIGLRDAHDIDTWSRALADGAIIVTKDEDFAAMAGRIANGPQVHLQQKCSRGLVPENALAPPRCAVCPANHGSS